MSYDEEKTKKIRVTYKCNQGVTYKCDQGNVTIGELLPDEMDDIEAFTLGSCWIRVSEDGRIERVERFATLPPISEDPNIPPKWIPYTDWTKEAPFLCNSVPELPEEPKTEYIFPSLIIHSLCGYNNVPYDWEARKLQKYGFECLRSRRGRDGRFWELWYLPGLYHAKDELKSEIDLKSSGKDQVTVAVDFLCRHVSFGSLDVCYQRAAMHIE